MELWTLGHRTGGSGHSFLLFASPMAADARWRAGEGRESASRQLSNQVISPWATPTVHGNTNQANGKAGDGLRTQAMAWPTPTATPCGSNRGGAAGRVGPERPSLSRLVYERPEGRTLSALWVEALMGFPPDWTATDGPPVVAKHSTNGSRRARPTAAKSRKTREG